MYDVEREDILNYLKEIKPYFQKKGLLSLALFGSYSKNSTNTYSDIDIAIKKDISYLKKQHPYLYFEMINELKSSIMKRFHKPVDILDIDSTSPFIKHIKKELIYV